MMMMSWQDYFSSFIDNKSTTLMFENINFSIRKFQIYESKISEIAFKQVF